MGKYREKTCPICGKEIKTHFWHLFYKHRKDEIIRAYLTLKYGEVDVSG